MFMNVLQISGSGMGKCSLEYAFVSVLGIIIGGYIYIQWAIENYCLKLIWSTTENIYLHIIP